MARKSSTRRKTLTKGRSKPESRRKPAARCAAKGPRRDGEEAGPQEPAQLTRSESHERARLLQMFKTSAERANVAQQLLYERRSRDPAWRSLWADPEWIRQIGKLCEIDDRYNAARAKWQGRLVEDLSASDRAESRRLASQQQHERMPIVSALINLQRRYGAEDRIETIQDLYDFLKARDTSFAVTARETGVLLDDQMWEHDAQLAWKHAEALRAADPGLPDIPSPSPRFADRLLQLRTWCVNSNRLESLRADGAEPSCSEPSNPLLASRPRASSPVAALVDAMVRVECASEYLLHVYQQSASLYSEQGPPKDSDWPEYQHLRFRDRVRIAAAVLAEAERKGGSEAFTPPQDTAWGSTLLDLRTAFVDWCSAISQAQQVLTKAGETLDAGEFRPLERPTTRIKLALRNLAGVLHPVAKAGLDGLGLVRSGCGPLPESFRNRLRELEALRTPVAATESEEAASPGWNFKDVKRPGLTISQLCKIGEINATTLSRIRAKSGVTRKPRSGEHGFEHTLDEISRFIATGKRMDGKRLWNTAAQKWASHLATALDSRK